MKPTEQAEAPIFEEPWPDAPIEERSEPQIVGPLLAAAKPQIAGRAERVRSEPLPSDREWFSRMREIFK